MKNTKSYITALYATTIRDLIRKANEMGITKNDIVYIMKENEAFILLYYTTVEGQ